MDRRHVIERMALVVLALPFSKGLAAAGSRWPQTAQSTEGDKAVAILEQSLPQMDGKDLEIKMIEIEYAPGASSSSHRHPGAVFGYVLEGSLQVQVEGQPLTTYSAGQVFYEPAGRKHLVGRNASSTQVASCLAFHVGRRGEPLMIPIADPHANHLSCRGMEPCAWKLHTWT